MTPITFIDGVEVRPWEEALPLMHQAKLIGLDIETTGLSPWRDRIAIVQLFADELALATIVQLRGGGLPPALRDLFKDPDRTFILHNGVGFDILFLSAYGVSPFTCKWYDTLVGETVINTSGRRDVRVSLAASLQRRLGESVDKTIDHGAWEAAELNESQLTYALRDVTRLPALMRAQVAKADETGQRAGLDFEMALVPIVAAMTSNGMPFDPVAYDRIYSEQLVKVQDAATRIARDLQGINVNSHKQVMRVFAEEGIDVPNTKAETLEDLILMGGRAGELAQIILDARAPLKRTGMYDKDWVAQYVHWDNRVRARYWQVGTDTGRFSSSNPNLQQIPVDMRAMFGGHEGKTIVSVDYGQIEVRVAAQLSGDPTMRAILNNAHQDPHTLFASQIFGVPYEQVTKEQRSLSKAMNFTLLFGGGEETLILYARRGGSALSGDAMRSVVRRYFETFTETSRMRDRAETIARTRRYVVVSLPTGLRRLIAGRQLTSTRLLNTSVQGTAAAGIKYALMEIHAQGLTPYLCCQIHDEVVFEFPTELVAELLPRAERAMITGMQRVIPDIQVTVESKAATHWSK